MNDRNEHAEAARWYYVIGQDGSLHLQRAVGYTVLHAGCLGTDFWYMRASHGVWVTLENGKVCMVERGL